jgi:hypothetical protein
LAEAQVKLGDGASGDSSLEGAKYEIGDIARMYGLPDATIFRRQGAYRSVALVEERAVAEDILTKARKRRGDAYIVRMSTWCPNFPHQRRLSRLHIEHRHSWMENTMAQLAAEIAKALTIAAIQAQPQVFNQDPKNTFDAKRLGREVADTFLEILNAIDEKVTD